MPRPIPARLSTVARFHRLWLGATPCMSVQLALFVESVQSQVVASRLLPVSRRMGCGNPLMAARPSPSWHPRVFVSTRPCQETPGKSRPPSARPAVSTKSNLTRTTRRTPRCTLLRFPGLPQVEEASGAQTTMAPIGRRLRRRSLPIILMIGPSLP